jgi:hypothetical protein
MTHLCFGCHELREIVYVDPTDRGYCAECVTSLPIGSAVRGLQFLSLTIPFKVGDRVEARTAGEIFDGVGTVTEVLFDLEHGGTPIVPMLKVVIDEPADELAPEQGCYPETCLTSVGFNRNVPVHG